MKHKEAVKIQLRRQLIVPVIISTGLLMNCVFYLICCLTKKMSPDELLTDSAFLPQLLFLLIFGAAVGYAFSEYRKNYRRMEEELGSYTVEEAVERCENVGSLFFFGDDMLISFEQPAMAWYSDIVKIDEFGSSNTHIRASVKYYICIYLKDGRKVALTNYTFPVKKYGNIINAEKNAMHLKMLKILSEKCPQAEINEVKVSYKAKR